jgi:hypothetical protein
MVNLAFDLLHGTTLEFLSFLLTITLEKQNALMIARPTRRGFVER